MIYRNSLKILLNNFSLVWKQLFYMFFSVAIVVGLTSLCALPVVDMLKSHGWVAEITELIETVYTSPKDLSQEFADAMTKFFVLIRDNFSSLWIYYLLIVFVVFVVSVILIHMSLFVCTSIVDAKMSSITRLGFLNTYFSSFWTSIKYAFVKLICSIPFFVLYIGIVLLYSIFAKNWLVSIILFPILILIILFIFSLKCTVFSCFSCEIINNPKRHTWRNLVKAVSKVKHGFWAYFSNYACMSLTVLLVNVFGAIFTLGAGLFVSIPATIVWLVSVNLTVYYVSEKRRFYVADNVIIDPNC